MLIANPGIVATRRVLSGLPDDAVPTSTRWRSYVTVVGIAGNNVSASEITMATSLGGSNVALGQSYSASNELNATYAASKAYDSDTGTFWVTSSVPPHWNEVTFGSAVGIVEWSWTSRPDAFTNESINTGRLEYWNGSAWVTWISVNDDYGWPSFVLTTKTWRRFGGTTAGRAHHWRIRETADFGNGTLEIQKMAIRVGGVDQTEFAQTTGRAFGSNPSSATFEPLQAFTTLASSGLYQALSANATLGWRFDTALRPDDIFIKAVSTSGNRCLKSFVIESSNDPAAGWTVEKTVTNEAAWSASEERTYTIP